MADGGGGGRATAREAPGSKRSARSRSATSASVSHSTAARLPSSSASMRSGRTSWTAPAQSSPTCEISAKAFRADTLKRTAQRCRMAELSGSRPHRYASIRAGPCSVACSGIDSESGYAVGELRQASAYTNRARPCRSWRTRPHSMPPSRTMSSRSLTGGACAPSR